jgi:hypothetical protein
LFAQASPKHTVVERYLLQPPVPSQRPSVPHEGAPWSLQTLRLSAEPAAIGVHVPRDDVSPQLRQLPPQASLQQKPSTQKFDAQSDVCVQAPPICFLPQLWFTHAMPAAQSLSLLHTVLHAPCPHVNGAQSMSPGATHAPFPSHVPAVFRRSPAHDCGTQTVCAAYLLQPPKPSQVPVWPQLAAPLSLQTPRGSAFPESMGEQMPSSPVSAHDTQAPVQATAQHTPSTQKLDPHSSLPAHFAPFILGPQPPATHWCPWPQSAVVVHLLRHEFTAVPHV